MPKIAKGKIVLTLDDGNELSTTMAINNDQRVTLESLAGARLELNTILGRMNEHDKR